MTGPVEPAPLRTGTGTGTTTVLEPREYPADEDGELFHYVRKDSIVESAVTGAVVTALCGAVFPVTRTPKPGSPVCPACKELLDMLRAFGDGGPPGEG